MNTVSLKSLVDTMQAGGLALERKAFQEAAPVIRVLSVSGAQAGIADGRDIHGNQFAPLKHTRPEGGGQPLRDKGLLAASLSASINQNEITLSANAPGARLLNYGGTVRAKKKFLTIPVTREAKRIGSPGKNRFPRRLFFRAAKGAAGGTLCEATAAGLVVHYVLVKSVTLPPRQFLGWSPSTLDKIQRVLADKYAAALAGLFTNGGGK